jgi:hypothetical protein
MKLSGYRQLERLPFGDTGREEEDFEILKIVRLWIESSNDPIIQLLGVLLRVGFGFTEVQNIADFIIFKPSGTFPCHSSS